METIIFGSGCFWCSEAIFQRIEGVKKVTSGYSGGTTINPTYEQVCSGESGHAEVIKVDFDEKIVSLKYLLEAFFSSHDPTTLNQQGNDVGTQYRSIIIFQKDEQEKIIKDFIKEKQKEFDKKIVTEIKKFENFYEAEEEHKNFYNKNKNNSYCRFVILPKLKKMKVE